MKWQSSAIYILVYFYANWNLFIGEETEPKKDEERTITEFTENHESTESTESTQEPMQWGKVTKI